MSAENESESSFLLLVDTLFISLCYTITWLVAFHYDDFIIMSRFMFRFQFQMTQRVHSNHIACRRFFKCLVSSDFSAVLLLYGSWQITVMC